MALLLLFSSPVAAEDSEEPLVLTVEDLARVAAKKSPALLESADGNTRLTLVDEADSGRDGADPERVAPTWREEYYRLKAIALKQAIERGEAVSFADESAPERKPEAAPAAQAPLRPGRACVYDREGKLVHAPPGSSCHTDHAERPNVAGHVCIYGVAGELLHAPPGTHCD